MNSFLFCTSYINQDIISCHPLRYKKWIEYYSKIMEDLGVDHIFLIDDGSPDPAIENTSAIEIISANDGLPATLSKKINIITFREHLGRPSQKEYPGWWRSFTYSIKIAEKYGFEKIIHIESDFYLVSDRLIKFIHSLNKGWTSLYSPHLNFPETAVQIICQDSLHLLENIRSAAEQSNYTFNQMAERLLPFTSVCKEFTGDRIGEIAVLKQWIADKNGMNGLDFYGQLPTYVRPFSLPDLQKLMHSIGATIHSYDDFTEDALIDILRKNDLIVAPA